MSVPIIKSTLTNVSGVRTYFDFLLPGGQWLDPGQEWTYWGDIYDWLRHSGDGPNRSKKILSLEYCLNQGLIEIKRSTSQVLYDETLDESRHVLIDDEAVVLRDVKTNGAQPDIVIGGGPPRIPGPGGYLADTEFLAYNFSSTGGTLPIGDITGNGTPGVFWDFSSNFANPILVPDTDAGSVDTTHALDLGTGTTFIDDAAQHGSVTTGDAPSMSFWIKVSAPVTGVQEDIIDWRIGDSTLLQTDPLYQRFRIRAGTAGQTFDIGTQEFLVNDGFSPQVGEWFFVAFGQRSDGTYYYYRADTYGRTELFEQPGVLEDYTPAQPSFLQAYALSGGSAYLDDIRLFKQSPDSLSRLGTQRGGA